MDTLYRILLVETQVLEYEMEDSRAIRMKSPFQDITPSLQVDHDRLENNLMRMQQVCDRAGIELWPHVKTHKCVAIARRQLELGATGLTCAKLSEAEAMLPSGVRRIFFAHSLATPSAFERAVSLNKKLDELVLAVTSLAHARVLASLTNAAGLSFSVALAVDTGLGREGLRTPEEAEELVAFLLKNVALRPVSIYTHEGQAYSTSREQQMECVEMAHARLTQFREIFGGQLPFWPGCSVTAEAFAPKPGVEAIRPGAYVFGDLFLSDVTGSCRREDIALTVRSTVVDRPTSDLALIDAGSKTFSGDQLPDGTRARACDGRDLRVLRLSEEHGFVTGADVKSLRIGDTIDWIPAHVCPVVNLARRLYLHSGLCPGAVWPIDANSSD